MPHRGRVVVIDDKTEDGEAVIRSLWKLQVPSFFLHYQDDIISNLEPRKKFEGIRYIFQDIALISSSFPDKRDYTAAAEGIDSILDDENGPWLLVAWSTWGNDPDKGDQYAKELFDYLSDRLPEGKRPYQFVVIDKRPYATDGEHGAVDTNLSRDKKDQLLYDVQNSISSIPSLEALGDWESNIRSSASKVLHDLCNMTDMSDADSIEKGLGGVLFQLAQAQEGARLNKSDDLSYPLYQMLSNMLYDKVSHIESDEVKVLEDVKECVESGVINQMLHWERYSDKLKLSPGCVYKWPEDDIVDLGSIRVSKDKQKPFIIDTFISNETNRRDAAFNDESFLENVTPVLIDITPACDHANDKAFWRRFLVGIIVSNEAKDHFYSKKKKALTCDYLKDAPKFQDKGEAWYLILNSKLVVSLRDKGDYVSTQHSDEDAITAEFPPDVRKLTPVGRIREQLLQEFIAWYGRMATRPGIVSLR